jgi:thiol-disulfide isomerase/thioredoxin
MTADHVNKLAGPQEKFADVQTQWVEDLEKFVEQAKAYPDSVDAMLELAIAQEFSEDETKAIQWYDAIVKNAPAGSPIHRKAEGAKRRLQSVGSTIRLAGKTLQGKTFDLASLKGKSVVVIQYWATWCEPCKADMPLLKDLRARFKGAFEVVGVCLDTDNKDVLTFLQENDPLWPQLFEPGGLESRLALEMGIQTLPTMILIDKQGKVVDRNIRSQSLESEVKKLLK